MSEQRGVGPLDVAVKSRDLQKHMNKSGCSFVRSGGKHDLYSGPSGRTVAVPRHRDLNRMTVKKICNDLGIKSIV